MVKPIKNSVQIFILGLVVFLLFTYCQSYTEVASPKNPYKNVEANVAYVGMETCRSCHGDKYDSFIKTGMGQSWDHATPLKSKATFNEHSTVFDSISNYFYQPFWKDDSLHIKEYRLGENGNDTTFSRTQKVEYVVGSGQHTNSHIYEENGYLYQAPITFYTQKGIWDLAPGFEGGFSSRFNRIIGMECMSCHNSLPLFVEGSENKYRKVESGIGCERCHGPGELHVKEKLAGIKVDTSKNIDYSIVNPAKLDTRELQMSVCQRCHLQGVAILKEGKKFDDFKPSMHLSEVMDVFLPEYSGPETKFIMASQAHRLTKSECYKNSQMTCMSCHNPHISVTETPRSVFNSKCKNCHSGKAKQTTCTLAEDERLKTNKNDCSSCHMKTSGSIDIPHVTVTDHFIRKPLTDAEIAELEEFIGLECVTSEQPSNYSKTKGYLHYFESYASNSSYLDSADYYLKKVSSSNPYHLLEPRIHLNYLKSDWQAIQNYASDINPGGVSDAWTAYRIGEAAIQLNELDKAEAFLNQAVKIMPLQADFLSKLATVWLKKNELQKAVDSYDELLEENPNHVSALTNLGFAKLQLGQISEAEKYYLKALALDPDYIMALLNLAGLYSLKKEKANAMKYLRQVLKLDPNNQTAKLVIKQLNNSL